MARHRIGMHDLRCNLFADSVDGSGGGTELNVQLGLDDTHQIARIGLRSEQRGLVRLKDLIAEQQQKGDHNQREGWRVLGQKRPQPRLGISGNQAVHF